MKNSPFSRWLFVLLFLMLAGCEDDTAIGQPSSTPSTAPNAASSLDATVGAVESRITALGVVRPGRQMTLSFRADGVIEAVHVQAGSRVQLGDELALLDSAELTATLQSAQADVEIRQAELDVRLSDAQSHPSDRAVAQAQLRQAQLEVQRLQWQLIGTTIRAPFAGIVANVSRNPGEWAETGAAVVDLIDTGVWMIETKNVSELAISRVRIGQPATVRIIPFSDHRLNGEVMTISPVAVVQQGDTTYTLFIRLDKTELALLPGMNAEVEITLTQ